jgi:hypothetical protein
VASPYKSGYVAAKHGLLGLVKTLALEGAQAGLATAVCPAFVRAPLVERQIADQARAHGMPEERVLEDVVLTPNVVKRLIEPEEVAEQVAFLRAPEEAPSRGRHSDGPRLDRAQITAMRAGLRRSDGEDDLACRRPRRQHVEARAAPRAGHGGADDQDEGPSRRRTSAACGRRSADTPPLPSGYRSHMSDRRGSTVSSPRHSLSEMSAWATTSRPSSPTPAASQPRIIGS